MIVYLLKCALTLTVLYALYGLTLRRETLHSMSRRVLLAILLLSMLLPMVPLRLSHSTMLGESLQEVEQWDTEGVQVSRALPAAVRQGEVARERVEASPTGHVSQWITLGYGLVAAGLLLRYAASVVALLRMVRRSLNPGLELEGVLLTMFDGRTNLALQVAEEVKRYFPGKVYSTVIPRNVRLSEAPSHGKPINYYNRTSRGAEAYSDLANEFLKQNR